MQSSDVTHISGCQAISPHVCRFKIILSFLSAYDDYSLVDDFLVSRYMVSSVNANSVLNRFSSVRGKSSHKIFHFYSKIKTVY